MECHAGGLWGNVVEQAGSIRGTISTHMVTILFRLSSYMADIIL